MSTTTAAPPPTPVPTARAGAHPTGDPGGDASADPGGDPGGERRLGRRLLPLHVAVVLQGVNLWYPIEKLFMDEIGFDPAAVGVMAAAYAGVVPALEVPSGILADRWSRRGVLIMASLALLVSSTVGGLSHDVTTYVIGAMFLGVYFALQSGTLDAVVYDTVLEETGSSRSFERRIGRVRLLESVGLVSSALAGGLLATVVGTRALYFLTVPFLVASIVLLRAFREPTLNRPPEPTSLRTHAATTYRALTRRNCLLPLVSVMVLLAMVANLLFEFGPLWLLALSAPAVVYGPHFAALGSSFGIAGVLAGRIALGNTVVVGALVAAMLASGGVLIAVDHAVPVVVAQVALVVLAVLLGILLTARLHDAVPSAIRSSVASGVGTLTWLAFLPSALLFGQVGNRLGVDTAAWLILALTALSGALLVRLSLGARREPSPDAATREAHPLPCVAAA
jgi:MFS family permease